MITVTVSRECEQGKGKQRNAEQGTCEQETCEQGKGKQGNDE